MKKTLSLLLLLAATPAVAQTYSVSGVAPADAKVVYLRNDEAPRGTEPDSIVVPADRNFRFAGNCEGKLFARVYTSRAKMDAIPVVLDGDVVVDFSSNTMAGTAENDALCKAYALLQSDFEAMAAINSEAEELQRSGRASRETFAPLVERYSKVSEGLAAKVCEVSQNNQDKKFPAMLLIDVYNDIPRSSFIAWTDANAAFMGTSMMARLKRQIDGWRLQQPGMMFTDLEEYDPSGKPHKLSEYVGKGNYVLVDFWASWCGPCMQEMPNVKAAYEKYHPKGFDIVGLSFDNDKKAWTEAIKNMKMTWHHLSDLKGWETIAAKTYGVNSIPATLLIGPDGKIVESGLRGEKLQAKLKEIYE